MQMADGPISMGMGALVLGPQKSNPRFPPSRDGEEFTKVRRATTSVKFQLVGVPFRHGRCDDDGCRGGNFLRMKFGYQMIPESNQKSI